MRRYHRRIDPKEYQKSLEMLRKVASLLAQKEAQPKLLPLSEAEAKKGETTSEERMFVARHNEKRNHMHFVLGWPWEELPTAATALKARRVRLSDLHCQAMMTQK